MLDLEVQPDRSLGNDQCEFIIGMPFQQACEIIRRLDRSVKGVQLWYSDKVPLHMDLVTCLSQDGISLHFDPISQRLKMIEVYNMSKVILRYCGAQFNSPHVSPTLAQVDQAFGATHPGSVDSARQIYSLSFRGLSLHFPLSSAAQAEALSSASRTSSVAPPEGSNPPLLQRLCIYNGPSAQEARVPMNLPSSCFYGAVHLDRLDIRTGTPDGWEFNFHLVTEDIQPGKLTESRQCKFSRLVKLGDTLEDVQRALGSPFRVFYKSEDKMKIHAPDSHRRVRTRTSDYFLNYFTLGADVLIDARTHRVKKLVLHTNYPGHYDFNMYYRCHFSLTLPVPERENTTDSDVTVTEQSRWDWLADKLQLTDNHPVVLNRSSGTNASNPFGPTYCYGVPGMILEVMPANKHIASVTFYQQIESQVSESLRSKE